MPVLEIILAFVAIEFAALILILIFFDVAIVRGCLVIRTKGKARDEASSGRETSPIIETLEPGEN